MQCFFKMGGSNKGNNKPMLLGKAAKAIEENIDPKAAALTTLGIVMGSKSMRNLHKEDINKAFLGKLYESERK